MIRLLGWQQLSTAAALVTAAAVVLNPVTPVLPDVTVPALFPPAVQSPLRAAQPEMAAVAPPTAVAAAAPALTLPSPAVIAAMPEPAALVSPAYPAAPPVPAAPPTALLPDFEIPTAPEELPVPLPMARPAIQVGGIPAHAGDRPLPVARQRLVPLAGAKPLPAAAVDAPGTPDPDSGAPSARGRGGVARPDTNDPSSRGHRGPAGGD